MINCGCSCGELINEYDSRGRTVRFKRWHSANKGKEFNIKHDKQYRKDNRIKNLMVIPAKKHFSYHSNVMWGNLQKGEI